MGHQRKTEGLIMLGTGEAHGRVEVAVEMILDLKRICSAD
jgi:hypothetical protein